MKRSRNIFLISILCLVLLSLTGCSSNNSAEAVAKTMVKYLSQEKYDKITDLIYQGNSYVDEKAFKEILEDNNLLIPGNSKIKVKEVGEEIADADGNATVNVKIEIDNKNFYSINTIKMDGKWYVYVPEFYDVDIVLAVPKNSKVKFNDKELSSEYKSAQEISFKVQHPSLSTKLELDDVLMETYVIKTPLKGEYDVVIEGEETITDVVYTYNNAYDIDSSNYIYDYSDDKGIVYIFNVSKENEDVKSFVNGYLQNIYTNAITNRKFEGVEKYFDKDDDYYEDIKSNYETAIRNFGDSTSTKTPNSYYDTFSISELEYKGIYNYNDDNVVVNLTYKLSYKYHKKYSDSSLNYDRNYGETMNTLMVLKKTESGYVIKKGYNLFIK